MTRIAVCLAMVFWAGAALAQAVVQTGEHGGFTRLVLPLETAGQWIVERQPSANTLVIDPGPGTTSYDLTRAFDRINRARIADLSVSQDGGLEIRLGCKCVHSAFQTSGPYLVVDIREGDPPEPDSPVMAESAPKPEPLIPSDQRSLRDDLTTPRIGAEPGLGPAPRKTALLPQFGLTLAQPVSDRKPERVAEMDAIDSSIISSIARAASEGLLDASVMGAKQPSTRPGNRQTSHPGTQNADSETSLDQQLAQQLSQIGSGGDGHISIGGDRCAGPEQFGVAKWFENSEAPAAETMRPPLFGEFDKIDRGAVLDQAKALLGRGFGAEARALLSLLPDAPRPLVALSHAVDGEPDPSGTLAGQQECEGPAALWSVLSSKSLDPAKGLNQNALIRSFEGLPPHLREHLGPILATRLTDAARDDLAANILRRVERMHGGESPSTSLAKAEIEMARGNFDNVVDNVLPLARSSGPEAAGAVVAAVEAAHETGQPIAEDVVQLTEAFAKEMRDHEDGPSLWRAHVLALLENDQFDAALTALRDADGISEAILHKTENDLAQMFVESAPDFVFLKHATALTLPQRSLKDARLTPAYFKRLRDLGLQDFALAEMETLPPLARSRELALLRARLFLDIDQPASADMILLGMQGDDVLQLRAEVRAAMGDYEFAKIAFASLGDEQRAADSAFLAGDWTSVAAQDNPRAQAVRLAQEALPEALGADITLAAAQTLSRNSEETRNALSALLAETRIGAD